MKKRIAEYERPRTRNIVVFNPDDITQVKRDGKLVYEKSQIGR